MLGRPSWLQKAKRPCLTLRVPHSWSLSWTEHTGTGTVSHRGCPGAAGGDGGSGHSGAAAGPSAGPGPLQPPPAHPLQALQARGSSRSRGPFPDPELRGLASPGPGGTLVLPPTPLGASLAQSWLRKLCLSSPWQPPSLPGCHGSPAPSRSRILNVKRTQHFGSSGAATTGDAAWGLGTEG